MPKHSYSVPQNDTAWFDLFDVLREQNEIGARSLASKFPEFSDELLGVAPKTKDLGSSTVSQARYALGRASIESALYSTIDAVEQVLSVTELRIRTLARVRLGSGTMSLVGSGGVLASLPFNTAAIAVASGLIAAAASSLNLWASYFEEQDGGAGKIRILREKMLEQVGILAVIQSKMSLDNSLLEDQEVARTMSSLNSVASELQRARAILGLKLTSKGSSP